MKRNERQLQEKIQAIQDTMFVLGGKWKLPIILSIYGGNKRFNDISNSIPKITNHILSKELKHLEQNLLVKRSVIDDYPVRIEYSVTDYAYGLEEVILPMESWGKKHRNKVKGNCNRFISKIFGSSFFSHYLNKSLGNEYPTQQ